MHRATRRRALVVHIDSDALGHAMELWNVAARCSVDASTITFACRFGVAPFESLRQAVSSVRHHAASLAYASTVEGQVDGSCGAISLGGASPPLLLWGATPRPPPLSPPSTRIDSASGDERPDATGTVTGGAAVDGSLGPLYTQAAVHDTVSQANSLVMLPADAARHSSPKRSFGASRAAADRHFVAAALLSLQTHTDSPPIPLHVLHGHPHAPHASPCCPGDAACLFVPSLPGAPLLVCSHRSDAPDVNQAAASGDVASSPSASAGATATTTTTTRCRGPMRVALSKPGHAASRHHVHHASQHASRMRRSRWRDTWLGVAQQLLALATAVAHAAAAARVSQTAAHSMREIARHSRGQLGAQFVTGASWTGPQRHAHSIDALDATSRSHAPSLDDAPDAPITLGGGTQSGGDGRLRALLVESFALACIAGAASRKSLARHPSMPATTRTHERLALEGVPLHCVVLRLVQRVLFVLRHRFNRQVDTSEGCIGIDTERLVDDITPWTRLVSSFGFFHLAQHGGDQRPKTETRTTPRPSSRSDAAASGCPSTASDGPSEWSAMDLVALIEGAPFDKTTLRPTPCSALFDDACRAANFEVAYVNMFGIPWRLVRGATMDSWTVVAACWTPDAQTVSGLRAMHSLLALLGTPCVILDAMMMIRRGHGGTCLASDMAVAGALARLVCVNC